ncbi:hypothetical protein KCU69_g20, partial [Aureobasidium melanogenum]
LHSSQLRPSGISYHNFELAPISSVFEVVSHRLTEVVSGASVLIECPSCAISSVMVFSLKHIKNLSKLSSHQSAYLDPEDIAFRNIQGPILELAIEFAGLEGEVEQFNMSAISMQPRERHESTHERKIHGAPVNFNTEVDDNDLLLCTATSKYTNKRPHRGRHEPSSCGCHGQEALVWKPASRCRSPNARSRSGAMMSSPPLDAVGVEFKALRSQRVVRGSSGLTRRGAIEAGRGPDRSLSLIAVGMHRVVSSREHSQPRSEARQITRTGIVLDGGHRFGALRRTIQTR